jgi:hypothetical protein
MAVDTPSKRRSMLALGLPFVQALPPPDGAIDTSAERFAYMGLYAFGDDDDLNAPPGRISLSRGSRPVHTSKGSTQ